MERMPVLARYADRMLEDNSLPGQRARKLPPAFCALSGLDHDWSGYLVPGEVTAPLQSRPIAPTQPRTKVWRKALIFAEFSLLGPLFGEQIAIELTRDDRHIT
jgi:hypothetical protein